MTKRQVSGGTQSGSGRDCRDAFLRLAKTCRKLGIAFWDYLGARLGIPATPAVPYLPDLIRCRSQPTVIEAAGAGGPEVLKPATAPVPEPRRDELLIRVCAAGVNRPDVQQRLGLYPPPSGASPLLGLEVAGDVAAVGETVTGIEVGEQVCAPTNGGGYAEYCVAPAVQALP